LISSDLPRTKGDPTAYLAWHPRPDPPTEAWRQAIWNVIHAAPGQFVDLLSTKLLSGKQCSRNALDPAPMSAHKHAGHHLQPVEVAAVKFFGHQRDLATIFIVRALRGTKKLDLGFGPGHKRDDARPIDGAAGSPLSTPEPFAFALERAMNHRTPGSYVPDARATAHQR
jgi:hypothetical protein